MGNLLVIRVDAARRVPILPIPLQVVYRPTIRATNEFHS